MYDVIIRDGLWFDGTGSEPQTRTLGIRDGVVATVSADPLDETGCPEVIDAAGKWIMPGFIDVHTHYDAEVLLDPGLRESVRQADRKDVEAIANAAFEAVPGDIDDDVAIVVVRTSPVRLQVEERTFQAEPIMVSEARRMAAETFAAWGMLDEQAELACLLVSEVVTNVVLHAASTPAPRRELVLEAVLSLDGAAGFDDPWDEQPQPSRPQPPTKEFTLRLRRGERSVWVEVVDSDMRLPRIRSAGETDEGGRGLYLVDQLAARWGSRPTNDGKAVWFEIPLKS